MKKGVAMRSYCLYKGNYLDIADMYEVIDGKQINIPEKLEYYRQLSNTHSDLTCPCGCGEVVVLVAGSVRKQHFRLLKQFANSNCEYQEESELSVKSKIILKCWLSKNLPEIKNEVRYRVAINELTDSKRRYEMTLYTQDYDFGIVYYRLSSNIKVEKVNLQKKYLETKILYIISEENEFNDDQYPEHLMKIQDKQGYCFYLKMGPNMLYEEAQARVCIYMRDYKGYWKSVVVCEGLLNEYEIDCQGLIFYNGKNIIDIVRQKREEYVKTQNYILEKKRLADEEKRKQEEEQRKWIQKQKEKQEAQKKKILREKAEADRKAAEEAAFRKEEELKEFLSVYSKLATIYNLLLRLESVKGTFLSDQSNGNIKRYDRELNIKSVHINMDRHMIEVVQDNFNKAYFITLEKNFTRNKILGTGALYTILDFSGTKTLDIEQYFTTTYICTYKEKYKALECTQPTIGCQHLINNKCMYKQVCRFQGK